MSLQEIDLLQVTQVAEYEVEWALSIKAAVEADDEIHNVSDFEYVHHALIAKENCEGAVERIRGLQYFREEYKITDSVGEGVQLIQRFLKQQENYLLTVDIDREKGHFVWVYDNAKIKPSAVRSPEDWRIYIGGIYYLFNAMHSNVEACRQGVVHICECEGMSRENFSMNHVRRLVSDLFEHYPFAHKEISWIRTPLAANLLYSFLRPLMRKDTSYKFQTGCTFNGYSGRLDGLFHIPNAETAERVLVMRLQEYLRTRQYLKEHFRLPAMHELEQRRAEMMQSDD